MLIIILIGLHIHNHSDPVSHRLHCAYVQRQQDAFLPMRHSMNVCNTGVKLWPGGQFRLAKQYITTGGTGQ